MAYYKKSIKDVLEDINRGKMYLPTIQRKYVWKDSQIFSNMLPYVKSLFFLKKYWMRSVLS